MLMALIHFFCKRTIAKLERNWLQSLQTDFDPVQRDNILRQHQEKASEILKVQLIPFFEQMSERYYAAKVIRVNVYLSHGFDDYTLSYRFGPDFQRYPHLAPNLNETGVWLQVVRQAEAVGIRGYAYFDDYGRTNYYFERRRKKV